MGVTKMEVIGNIKILSKGEIVAKGKELYPLLLKRAKTDFGKADITENYNKLLKEPLPYCLFRLNELMNFNLNGVGCVITEKQYMDRLEQLPPQSFQNDILSGYIVPECVTSNIYEHLFKHDKKRYCVIMATNFKVV